MNETDLETLKVSKQFIRKREIEITGHVPVLGFRHHMKDDKKIN